MFTPATGWEAGQRPTTPNGQDMVAEMTVDFDSDTALGRWETYDLIQCYLSWCEACHAVRQTYRRWADSTPAERCLAYSRYVAALDREEQAARIYADQIERLSGISG
jgi:hypothetical protein